MLRNNYIIIFPNHKTILCTRIDQTVDTLTIPYTSISTASEVYIMKSILLNVVK